MSENAEFVPGTTITKPTVELTDGNAFYIVGSIIKALKKAGVPKNIVDEYKKKSVQGDFDHLLSVAMEYAEVDCGD